MNDPNTAKVIADTVIQALKAERVTLITALSFIAKGEAKAAEIGVPMTFTVVDEGGNIVAMHRMDDSLLASISVSYSKAYTAAALRSSTAEAAKTILPGQSLYGLQNTHPGQFCLFGGGVPIVAKGRCIGGLGVSGGTAEQDTDVAKHAVI